MKRNWDLIRLLLLKIEELEPNALLTLDSFPENQHQEISCHLEILQEGGLLEGKIHKTPGGSPHDFHLIRLTWLGHDFIECIRTDSKWEAIKKKLTHKGVEINLDNILFIAKGMTQSVLIKD